MTILLSRIWSIPNPEQYKVHFARRSKDGQQPLEVLSRDLLEWQTWQEYRPRRDEFNRPFIFSLAQFYHETDCWLFGGVFRVLGRNADQYTVEQIDEGRDFVGRLKLRSAYSKRATRVNFENHYPDLQVQEILREPYSGRSFPGFESVDLSFEELETITRHSRPDWRAALSSIKGVYLISDSITKKFYIGSAYGDQGIWSRWCSYIANGHGGNVELKALVSDPSLDYCRKAFRFDLLEARPVATPDEVIIARESFWKRILFTRGADGLNRN